jgi:hypothetical protein
MSTLRVNSGTATSGQRSRASFRFPPMMVFAIWIEHAIDVSI